jgi:membrane protease subunit (stomatin/prohibitin family)
MGFFDKLLGEFIDVIDWTDSSDDTMVYRFERYGNEIKYGAKLTVRESQVAIFVNEGQIADIFTPGIYELHTQNMPIMTTLNHWDHGFESPFKAEIYFFNLRQFLDLKWGTKNPIMLRDKEFGPVRLRAFGTYGIKISNPKLFLQEIVGTDGYFTVDEVTNQLRNVIVSRFASILGQANIPVLDLAGNYDKLSTFIDNEIKDDFKAYGLDLLNLLIENISLPAKVEEALDKRTSMGLAGDLDQYLKYQTANALEGSANGTNSASEAMSMGMGFAMAAQMANNINLKNNTTIQTPPIPQAQTYHFVIDNKASEAMTIEQIKQKISQGVITKSTLSWMQGMNGWEEASNIDELNRLFDITMPPIPTV